MRKPIIFIAGNGGLMAEALHFAAELTGRYHKNVFIPGIALGSNQAELTALTNDFGWENAYAHLVNVFGEEGDTFIGMTTSKSPNIIKACQVAKKKKMKVILLDEDNLEGETTAEKQEFAISFLHRLAEHYKDEVYARIQK